MIFSDDPLKDFHLYDDEKEQELKKLPKCDYCKKYIQDDYLYDIGNEIVCEDCMKRSSEKI